MEIDLDGVPYSEDLVYFVRRCARAAFGCGDPDVRVRVRRGARAGHDVSIAQGGSVVQETDPDVFLAVRNAFARVGRPPRETPRRRTVEAPPLRDRFARC